MAGHAVIDEVMLADLVGRFYSRVRKDKDLGPIFNGAVHDWPGHLETLTKFWSSIMLGTGRYKGQPMVAHMRHKDAITPELFDRWLILWAQTSNEVLPEEAAAAVQEKARRIAESLKLGLFFNPANRDAKAR